MKHKDASNTMNINVIMKYIVILTIIFNWPFLHFRHLNLCVIKYFNNQFAGSKLIVV